MNAIVRVRRIIGDQRVVLTLLTVVLFLYFGAKNSAFLAQTSLFILCYAMEPYSQ
jgi:hypothetical protein